MTAEDVSMALAVLGATSVLTAWLARRTGDAARDAGLVFLFGACLSVAAAGARLL